MTVTPEALRTMPEPELRTFAEELLHENRRLRTILDALAKAGVGMGAVAELTVFRSETSSHLGVVVCRADRDEREFLGDIRTALEALAATFLNERCGIDGAEFEESTPLGSTREDKGGAA